jgi:hypothetical protein
MTGIEYVLSEVMEPHLFIMRKQKRDGPDKITAMLAYYILDGSIYQAPQLSNVFAARIVCSISLSLLGFLFYSNTVIHRTKHTTLTRTHRL